MPAKAYFACTLRSKTKICEARSSIVLIRLHTMYGLPRVHLASNCSMAACLKQMKAASGIRKRWKKNTWATLFTSLSITIHKHSKQTHMEMIELRNRCNLLKFLPFQKMQSTHQSIFTSIRSLTRQIFYRLASLTRRISRRLNLVTRLPPLIIIGRAKKIPQCTNTTVYLWS